MLRAREQVAPDAGREVDVRAFWRDVREGRIAPPVLGARVGVHHLRHRAGRALTGEQAFVGVRRQVAEPWRDFHRWLGVAVVELAPPPTRDVRIYTVEDPAAGLIYVQAVVQERAQEAAALGDAERVGTLQRPGAGIPFLGRPVAQEAGEVAGREQPAAHDRTDARRVEDVVDLARLEAAFEPDVRVVGRELAVFLAGEPPPPARDVGARTVWPVLHGHTGAGFVHVGGEVGDEHGGAEYIAEADAGRRAVAYDLHTNRSGDGPPVYDRLRGGQPEQAGRAARDIPLPAAPGDCPAVAKEVPVAHGDQIRRREGRDRVVEEPEGRHAPAVEDVEKEPTGPPRGVNGLEDAEIGVEANEPIRAPFRQRQIDDLAVRRVRRVDSEVRDAFDAFVRSGVAE